MSQIPNDSAGGQPANAATGVGRSDAPGERKDGTSGDRGDRDSPERSLDAILRILAVRRRRTALYVLYRNSGSTALADLADEVASVEGIDPERVTASLLHVHLPKLADADVVDYDAETRTVRLADRSDWFRRFLVRAAEDERRFLGPAFEDAFDSES